MRTNFSLAKSYQLSFNSLFLFCFDTSVGLFNNCHPGNSLCFSPYLGSLFSMSHDSLCNDMLLCFEEAILLAILSDWKYTVRAGIMMITCPWHTCLLSHRVLICTDFFQIWGPFIILEFPFFIIMNVSLLLFCVDMSVWMPFLPNSRLLPPLVKNFFH